MILFEWFLLNVYPVTPDSITKASQLPATTEMPKSNCTSFYRVNLLKKILSSFYLSFQAKQGGTSMKEIHLSGTYNFIWVISGNCPPCNSWFNYEGISVTGHNWNAHVQLYQLLQGKPIGNDTKLFLFFFAGHVSRIKPGGSTSMRYLSFYSSFQW